jgi:hypothetical protein
MRYSKPQTSNPKLQLTTNALCLLPISCETSARTQSRLYTPGKPFAWGILVGDKNERLHQNETLKRFKNSLLQDTIGDDGNICLCPIGCTRRAMWGDAENGVAVFCTEHRASWHVDLTSWVEYVGAPFGQAKVRFRGWCLVCRIQG